MNSRVPRILNGEAPPGGYPKAPGRRTGHETRPHAFLGDNAGGVGRGFCCASLQLGDRAVCFSCGQG